MMDEVEGEEKICIAHSLGATNWLFGALGDIYKEPFDRVLLVAPPDPQMTQAAEGIEGEPLDLTDPNLKTKSQRWAKRLVVIASDNDRWLPRSVSIYEAPLEVKPIIFPGAGHFSLADGWGNWSGLIEWIETKEASSLLSTKKFL
jgi:predicted alpha/beta hydrolase family esterase